MKKALIGVLVAMALLTGCKEDGAHVGNVQMANPGDDYSVRELFTADGCTVYRFYDGRTVYFTNCKGTTSWEVSKSNGKGTKTEYMTVETK